MIDAIQEQQVEQSIHYYHFKCVRCQIDFYDITDLKNHYFKLHIANKTGRKRRSSWATDDEASPKRLKPSPKSAEQLEQDRYDETMLNRVSCLVEDQIKLFNWKGIDESALHANLTKYEHVPKKRHLFKHGVIVWAQWKNMMWPAVVKKTNKEGGSALKISFRHYEIGAKRLGKHVFKLDSSRVELFYRCRQHADYKVLGKSVGF
jgi:hypothetical protein